ncbi:MAG TPA: hypothetical protein VE867_00550 [Candidatus Binatia bacterium]|nr:hypothetical protein [Candidatus Binatia bacterium]
MNKFAIDFDMVARPWLRTEVCANFAIDCDAARSDQLIAIPAGTETGSSEEAVETHDFVIGDL